MASFRHYYGYGIIVAAAFFLLSCGTHKYSPKRKESCALTVLPGRPVNPDQLKKQVPAYAARDSGAVRGVFDVLDPSTGVSMAYTGVKTLIANEQKKYQASYSKKIGDDHTHRLIGDSLYFYNEPSNDGPFGNVETMQFQSFCFHRLLEKKRHPVKTDTPDIAMMAIFELDTSNLCEIGYDGIFRLKIKKLRLYYAKAKLPRHKKKINLDFTVQFTTSYITKEGQFYSNVVLGTFTKNLAGVTVQDKYTAGEGVLDTLYKKFEGQRMDGWSFIVPRSYSSMNDIKKWNKGAFCINVTVKETSKSRYVNKISAVANSGNVKDASTKLLIWNSILDPSSSGSSKSKGK